MTDPQRPAPRQVERQDPAMPRAEQWQRLFQVASLVTTVAIVPAAGWAWRTTESQHEQQAQLRLLQNDVANVRAQLDTHRTAHMALLEELRGLRASVDALRVDLLQRMTRVETRLDDRKESPR